MKLQTFQLGDLVRTISYRGHQTNQSGFRESGKFPIIDQGQTEIAGFTDDVPPITSDLPIVIFGDHTRLVKYASSPFVVGADGVKLIKSVHPEISDRLLYWLIAAVAARIPSIGYGRHFTGLCDLAVTVDARPERRLLLVDALDKCEAAMKTADAIIAAKREQKRGLMQQLLTGKVRFPGFTEPWKTVRLGEIANLRGSKGTSSHLPHLRCIELEHIESGTGEIIGEASAGSTVSLKTEFAPGDVLFGKLRPYLRKFALVEFAGLCSTEIWALIPDQTVITSGYLRLLVEAPGVQRAANATSGTKMPRADWDVVSTTPVHLPPKSEQDRITLLASAIDSEIRLLSAQRQALATQRRGLMERLLSGEIDIPSSDTSAA